MQRVHMQALRGLRVVEFTHVIAGPFTGLQLQMLGAQVVKVEPPRTGDFLNSVPHGRRTYQALNGGKEVRHIDLTRDDGQAEALALVRQADVLLDSFAPGALARRGLDYERLRVSHPRLVYCSISGFGSQDAAWGRRGAYDHVVQAMTGMAQQNGHEGDPPIKVGFPLTDTATAMAAVSAILAALLERERTGAGQYLEVGMARAALQLLFPMACEAALTGRDSPRVGNRGYTGSPGSAFFECRDGWLALGANTAEQLQRALAALAVATTAPADACADALLQTLAQALRPLGAAAAEALMVAAGVPAARLRTVAQFVQDGKAAGWLDDAGAAADRWGREMALGWRSYVAADTPSAAPRAEATPTPETP